MKNPWMSAWLSAANTWSGAARGMAAAETRRNQNAWADDVRKQALAFWFPFATPAPAKSKAAKTRRRR
jgi:hypothetical protein